MPARPAPSRLRSRRDYSRGTRRVWAIVRFTPVPARPLTPAALAQDSEPITALALSPDGRILFTASRSLQQRCWSLETGQQLRSFKGHRAPVADLAVDASGGLLASSSADRSVRVWDVDGGYCTHAFTGHRWVWAWSVTGQAGGGSGSGSGAW